MAVVTATIQSSNWNVGENLFNRGASSNRTSVLGVARQTLFPAKRARLIPANNTSVFPAPHTAQTSKDSESWIASTTLFDARFCPSDSVPVHWRRECDSAEDAGAIIISFDVLRFVRGRASASTGKASFHIPKSGNDPDQLKRGVHALTLPIIMHFRQ